MKTEEIGRRQVIVGAAAASVMGIDVWIPRRKSMDSHRESEVWPVLAARTLPHLASGRIIGIAFIKTASKPEVTEIIKRVATHILTAVKFDGDWDVGRSIVQSIQDDYSMERTKNVEGWVLSETEVALCATLALRDRRLTAS